MANILVYALHYDGAINKNSLGAVSEGAKLAAELGGEAHAILLGENVRRIWPRRSANTAPRRCSSRRAPRASRSRSSTRWRRRSPAAATSYALFGGGLLGFEIGAGLAARLGAGVVMEVTAVRAENGELIAERPILGDSSISEVKYRSDGGHRHRPPQRVRDQETSAAPTRRSRQLELRALARRRSRRRCSPAANSAARTSTSRAPTSSSPAVAVSARPEGFQLAEDLAAAFGGNAAVAATRAVVDAGWYPYAAQIGQTGKTVSPKLYLAAGISGAIQHKVGMQGSENIVAINKDANAPIFEFSDLGIVGDLNKILPKLTEAVKAKKGSLTMSGHNGSSNGQGRARGLPPAGRLAQGVHQARPRRRGRADRGRRGDRRRRHRRPGVRQPAAAAAGRRPGDDGAPRRSAGGGDREGQDLRRAQPVRRGHAARARCRSCSRR